MNKPILMPDSMAGGTLARWLKRPGVRVQAGEIVAEIETDKASLAIESPCAGTLSEICVPEGTTDIAADRVLALVAE